MAAALARELDAPRAAAALRSWYEEARLGRAMRAAALGLRHRGLRAAVNGWRGVTDTRATRCRG